MHRFFIAQTPNADTIVLSDADQFHHLRDVLRLRVGDEVMVCDARGEECVCSIIRLGAEEAHLAVRVRHAAQPKRVSLTVDCAIPKKNKMDEIVDKLTQLGVDRIIPMETARGIVKLGEATEQARLGRWQRLAQAASQQSQRSRVLVIARIAGLGEVLSQSTEFDLKLILALSGDRKGLTEVLSGSKAANIIVLIGPEGDFTPEEVGLAKKAGFVPVSLGGRVLRVETAAIAVASYVSLSFDL
jgi:16S rRNA (uracil1498-N3)-methyltransferase